MADRNRQLLLDLMQKPGNNVCADCGASDPEWASCNIGVFVCKDCAGIHRSLGVDTSRVKSIKLDNWDNDQIQSIESIGNEKAKQKFEKHVPPYYRRPSEDSVEVLKAEWIRAKYSRKEFLDPDKQKDHGCYFKEGLLWKKGRDDKKFQIRKFILSPKDNKLVYYNKETAAKSKTDTVPNTKPRPKAEIDLDDINATFVPDKVGNPNGLQITYFQKGSTRNIFVYSQDSKEIVDWYNAIRAAKLERRRIAFPDRDEKELAEDITRDFLLEGWLCKMGPNKEPFRKRWFTLDRRKLMYLEDPLHPFAKGEIFIGHRDGGYSAIIGAKDAKHSHNHVFTLHTPERDFQLSAETREDMEQWICALQSVTDLPLTPQDTKLASLLCPKRSESFKILKKN